MSRGRYLALCAAACAVPILAELAQLSLGTPLPGPENVYVAAGLLLLAVLSYPAGVIGTLAAVTTMWAGILTPAEAVVLATPLFAGAGYLQWYVLLPGFFRRP